MQIDNILSKLQGLKNWLLSCKIGGWPGSRGGYYISSSLGYIYSIPLNIAVCSFVSSDLVFFRSHILILHLQFSILIELVTFILQLYLLSTDPIIIYEKQYRYITRVKALD